MDKVFEYVTVKFWFGGSFTKNELGIVYTGRTFRTTAVDVDEFCWFTLMEECEKSVKFNRVEDAIFYMKPGVGLERVVDDRGAQLMCEIAVKERLVDCYIVFGRDIPYLTKLLELSEGEVNPTSIVKCSRKLTPRRKMDSKSKIPDGPPLSMTSIEYSVKDKDTKKKTKTLQKAQTASQKKTVTKLLKKSQTPETPSSVVAVTQTSKTVTQKSQTPEIIQTSQNIFSPKSNIDPYEQTYDFNDERISDLFDYHEEESDLACLNVNGDVEWEDLSEGEDPGYNPDEDSGSESVDGSDVELVDENDNENVIDDFEIQENLTEEVIESDGNSDDEEAKEARNKVKQWNAKALAIAKQLQLEASSKKLVGQESQLNEDVVNQVPGEIEGNLSDYDKSGDECDTPVESDENPIPGKRRRNLVPVVNERTDFSKLKWKVGIKFPNREEFRDCVTRYAIAQGRNLTFVVSDKVRGKKLGVKCKPGCPFHLYGSWDNRLSCFMVKSVKYPHNCQRTMDSNKQLKSSWVAKQFLDVFKARPHWPAADIIETVRRAYKVIIKKDFAYKVKYTAHRLLHGSMREHYSKVGSYMKALEKQYPGSVFTLTTNPNVVSSVPVFQRLFICFDTLKQGWLQGCRKLLCVDACFLKTFLGGQLISAIGRDGNDQMYPLAWAVVEGENNESYQWFFQELKKAVGEEDGEGWTIISDEHQSIITSVAKELPKAEHRRCARHIFANWHKSYKGEEMKMLFWNCAKAYNEPDFNEAVAALREVDPRAADAFLALNPSLFCRAFINTHTTNNVIVNNMAETFNAWIINARSKHLIYMLEEIRTQLMQRMVIKKRQMVESTAIVCPNIQAILEKEKDKAAYCKAWPSIPNEYQVIDVLDEVAVNLADRTCSCRKWDVTGIPCSHAVAAIFDMHAIAEDYVHPMYKREAYITAYNMTIGPCPGERYWPRVEQPMIPPPIKIGPGRPRKKRRRDPHEDPKRSGRLTKHGVEMTCSVCKSKEHNKRRCPQKDTVIQPQPKRGRGRPRVVNVDNRENIASSSQVHHDATAHPTRTGRGGRVIRRGGRGAVTGGTRGAMTGGTRGRNRGGRRGGRGGRAPQGMGVLFDDQGNAFTNDPGNTMGPRNILSWFTSQPDTQVSTNEQPN